MTQDEFRLDVSHMSDTAERCKKLAQLMQDMRQTIEDYEVEMINSWLGEGAKEFGKKFYRVIQQFKDLRGELDTIAENILTAQEAYIQTDMDLAKTLEGVQELGTAHEQAALKEKSDENKNKADTDGSSGNSC